MITMTTLGTPWMLMIQANGAASPANDSSAALVSAGVGGGSESLLLIVLAVALVGGLAAMLAGDVVRKTESGGRATE